MTAVSEVTVRRLRSHLRVPVLRAGYALVASAVATSALGAIYWFVAARRFDSETVGVGSSLVAATSLLGGIANLGLKNGLIRFVPLAGRRTGRLIAQSYAVAVVAAVTMAAIFLAGLHVWSPRLLFLREGPLPSAVFLMTVAAWTVFVLQDSVLVGIGRSDWVLWENVAFSFAKIAMLLLIVGTAPQWSIFLSWGAPTFLLLVVVNWAIVHRWLPGHARVTPTSGPEPFGRVVRFSIADQAAALLWMATLDGLPLLVLWRSGASAAAHYFLAAQIVYGLYVVSGCLGAALLAEASRNPAQATTLNQRVSRQAFAVVIPATAVVVATAPWTLAIFGSEYARNGTGLLRLLALSAVPYTVTSLAVSRARVRGQMRRVIAGHAAIFVGCVGAAAILEPSHGLNGVGVGVLLGHCVVAAVVLAARWGETWGLASHGLVASIGRARNGTRRIRASLRLEDLLGRLELPADFGNCTARVVSADNDMIIAELRGPRGAAVLKLATGRRACASLRDHVRSMGAFGTDRQGAGLDDTLPVLISEGSWRRCRYVLETRCPGVANSAAFAGGPARPAAFAAVAAHLNRVHGFTARVDVVEEALVAELVDRPLSAIAARFGRGNAHSTAQVAALRAELRDALIGRRLTIARTHGDLTPGNVLLTEEGTAVSGLVDWECSRADGLPEVDRAMFVLATRRELTGEELGVIVLQAAADPRNIDPIEASFLAGPTSESEGLSNRHRVLLAWLAHVESNLQKSDRYGTSRLWLRRNVLDVVNGLTWSGTEWPPRAVARRASVVESVRRHHTAVGTAAVLATAATVWLFALGQVDVRAMRDTGLVSVVPIYGWGAIALVIAAVVHALTRPSLPERRLLALVVGFIVIIHATAPVLYQTLRYSWAWKHVGIIDYIDRNGAVDPKLATLDVYHNWPGFFSANATLVEMIGVKNAVAFAMWAPVVNNFLNLAALLFLLPTLCADRRVVWTAVWLFFLGNWVGQDYFSPQAMAYFLHLVVIALLLTHFRRHRQRHTDGALAPPSSSLDADGRRLSVSAGLTVLSLSVTAISSHQLTPGMLLIAMGALMATRRISAVRLVLGTLLAQALWLVGPARTFAARNLRSTLESFGAPVENAGATLRNTAQQSAGQVWVSLAGRAMVAAMAVLAIIGVVSRLRRGHRDGTALLMVGAPVLLVVANEFGGEILFRAYLFGMPFLALFAAWAIFPDPTSLRRSRTVALATISLALFGGFVLSHFGKDRSYHFSTDEVAAATYLNQQAIGQTLLVEGNRNYPAQFLNYERFVYVPIAEEPPDGVRRILEDPAAHLARWLEDPRYRDGYVLITRSQKAALRLEGLLPDRTLDVIEGSLRLSPKFAIVFENRDATVFRLAPSAGS